MTEMRTEKFCFRFREEAIILFCSSLYFQRSFHRKANAFTLC